MMIVAESKFTILGNRCFVALVVEQKSVDSREEQKG